MAQNSSRQSDTKARCEQCGKLATAGSGKRAKKYCSESCKKKAARIRKEAALAAVVTERERSGRNAGAKLSKRSDGPTDTNRTPISRSTSLFEGASSQLKSPFLGSWTTDSPRYYAKFAAAGQADAGKDRRFVTRRMRALLREITTIDRCRACGAEVIGSHAEIKINAGVAHFSGVETCGRIWLCPVCSAKIRVARGAEIAEGVGNWIRQGGQALFLTVTLPHEKGDALQASFSALVQAWRWVTSHRKYKIMRKVCGMIGWIKAIEVTHGNNGWHPHAHMILLLDESVFLTRSEGERKGKGCAYTYAELFELLDRLWVQGLDSAKWPTGKYGIRLRLDMVERSASKKLADYVTKLQDGKSMSTELTRADLKSGRKENRTPFEILRDFGNTGNAADLTLWHEFEDGTYGRSAIQWSRNLRAKILPEEEEEKSDEELAAEEIGGETVGRIEAQTWREISRIPGLDSLILDSIENGGFQEMVKLLVTFNIDPAGVEKIDSISVVE